MNKSIFPVLWLVALASAVAQDKPVFSDNFTNGDLSNWSLFGDWTTENGILTVDARHGPKAVINGVNLRDCEIEVDVQVSAHTQAGVVFRVNNPQSGIDAYDGYYTGINSGHEQLKSHVLWGAARRDWRTIAIKPVEIRAGNWYHLRVQVSGGNVRVFVDDLPVDTRRFAKIDGIDSQFTKGQIGLRALGGQARFRNVVVRAYTPPTLAATYTNPMPVACADPGVLFHEGVYYGYCTYSPDHPNMPQGIRLYVSRDLVNWMDRGYVLKNEDSWGSSRFWAPDVIEKDGVFYMYYAADVRICVATSRSPLGPFKQVKREPMVPASIKIDAHVFKDDDGQCYFYYVAFNNGNEIWGGKLNADMMTVDATTLRLMASPDRPWERHMANIVEGPAVVKHKGTYYMTYSGSHFKSPHYAIGYTTSDSPLGPWKEYAYNPIMKSTEYAHGTAHHCLTTSPDGKEMFVVYHRHNTLTTVEPRQMAIDRIQFVPQPNGPDILEILGPTSSPQPMPSGAVR